MEKIELEVGDVVQLKPDHKFGGMFVIVTEPKSWGCQGYLSSPIEFEATKFKGVAYVRPKLEDFEWVGKAPFIIKQEAETNGEPVFGDTKDGR